MGIANSFCHIHIIRPLLVCLRKTREIVLSPALVRLEPVTTTARRAKRSPDTNARGRGWRHNAGFPEQRTLGLRPRVQVPLSPCDKGLSWPPIPTHRCPHSPDAPASSRHRIPALHTTRRSVPFVAHVVCPEAAQEAGYAAGSAPIGMVPDWAPRTRRRGSPATSSRRTKWSCSSTKHQPCP